MKKKNVKKHTLKDYFDSIQNSIIYYYVEFGIYDIRFKSEQLFDLYNIALEKEYKKNISKKEFYEKLKEIKNNAITTFSNKNNGEKLYIFVSFDNTRNNYRFQMYDDELMDDTIFNNFTYEDFNNSMLNLINPPDENINFNLISIEEIKKDFILIKKTEEETMFSIKMSFEDIFSDICSFNYRMINPKLLKKYIKENIDKVIVYDVKSVGHNLRIKYDNIKGTDDYLFIVKAT